MRRPSHTHQPISGIGHTLAVSHLLKLLSMLTVVRPAHALRQRRPEPVAALGGAELGHHGVVGVAVQRFPVMHPALGSPADLPVAVGHGAARRFVLLGTAVPAQSLNPLFAVGLSGVVTRAEVFEMGESGSGAARQGALGSRDGGRNCWALLCCVARRCRWALCI